MCNFSVAENVAKVVGATSSEGFLVVSCCSLATRRIFYTHTVHSVSCPVVQVDAQILNFTENVFKQTVGIQTNNVFRNKNSTIKVAIRTYTAAVRPYI